MQILQITAGLQIQLKQSQFPSFFSHNEPTIMGLGLTFHFLFQILQLQQQVQHQVRQ